MHMLPSALLLTLSVLAPELSVIVGRSVQLALLLIQSKVLPPHVTRSSSNI
jgi:hypothetical protein